MPAHAGSARTASTGRGGGSLGPDTAGWDVWWAYNRDRFLQIRMITAVPLAVTPRELEGPGPSSGQPLELQRARRQVVPAVERMLEGKRPSVDMISSGLLAMARAGAHPRFADRLLGYASHANQEVSETAILALGALKAPHIAGTLESILRDGKQGRQITRSTRVSQRNREFAAYALALLAESSPFDSIRQTIAAALLDTAEDTNGSGIALQAACLIALAQVPLTDPREELDRLERILMNRSLADVVHAHVPNAAARLIASAQATQGLAGSWVAHFRSRVMSSGQSSLLRLACAQALGWLPLEGSETQVVETLVQVSHADSDYETRHLALLSLGRIASRGGSAAQRLAIPRLLRTLDSGSFYERGWSALALGIMGYEAREQGRMVPGLVGTRLRMRLDAEVTPSVRSALAIALGLLQDRRAEQSLRDILKKSSDPEVRGRIAVALGLMEATESAAELRDILKHAKRQPQLLRAAAEGLALMRDEEGVKLLVEMIGRAEVRVFATTAAVAQAIGATRDFRAVGPLLDVLEDQRGPDLSRAFAASALGLLTDTEDLPFRARFARGLDYRSAPNSLVDPAGLTGLLNLL